MGVTILVILAGFALTVAGAVALWGPVAAVIAGLALVVLGVVVDWEKAA